MYFYPRLVLPEMNLQTAVILMCYCVLAAVPILIDLAGEYKLSLIHILSAGFLKATATKWRYCRSPITKALRILSGSESRGSDF